MKNYPVTTLGLKKGFIKLALRPSTTYRKIPKNNSGYIKVRKLLD